MTNFFLKYVKSPSRTDKMRWRIDYHMLDLMISLLVSLIN